MKNNEWKLWLDDMRNPIDYALKYKTDQYIWAVNTDQAEYYVEMWGPPVHMALDHDLGLRSGGDVPVFLKWLQRKHPDFVPTYLFITANPVGEQNMRSFLESWKKSLTT